MIQKGPRAVAEAIKVTMATYLPGVLTAVATAWSNDVPLPAPSVYYATIQVETPEPTTLEVDVQSGQQRANSAQTSTLEGFGEVNYDFTVVVNCAGESVDTLVKKGQMYGQAIWEVLMQHNRLDEQVSGLTGIDPLQFGTTFGGTDLTEMNLAVGWRGVAYVEQSVG